MAFAGYVAIKQLPQIHTAVNSNYSKQQAELAALREEINLLNKTALAKAEAREAAPGTTIAAVPPEPTVAAEVAKELAQVEIADPTIVPKTRKGAG